MLFIINCHRYTFINAKFKGKFLITVGRGVGRGVGYFIIIADRCIFKLNLFQGSLPVDETFGDDNFDETKPQAAFCRPSYNDLATARTCPNGYD